MRSQTTRSRIAPALVVVATAIVLLAGAFSPAVPRPDESAATTTASTGGGASSASETSSASVPSSVTVLLPTDVGDNESLNFQPARIKVVIGVNNTIVWNDLDAIQHTVKSVSVPRGAAQFDSGILNQGQVYTVTLAVPGTYRYDCSIHPDWMVGTIVVLP